MRIQLVSPEGAKYIGFAKTHLALLDKTRQDVGLARLQKYYHIDDFLIFVCSDALNPLIRITGGSAVGQILIGNDELVYVYDYIKNTLSKVPTSVGGSALVPIYNGRCQNEGVSQITYDSKWSSSVLGDSLEYIGGLNVYEAAFFLSGNTLSARIGADLGAVATIPDLLLPFYGATGSMFSAMSYKMDSSWNLYRGAVAYGLNLSNKVLSDLWYWVPSFFTVQPADLYGLKPGWYYGQYPNPDYDFDNALTNLKISFKGLVDSRYTGGPYTYGWCEQVTEVGGEPKNDLNFFFQDSPLAVPGNPYFYREIATGLLSQAMITIGADLQGFNRSLKLTPDIANPDVSMWSFAGWADGEDLHGAVGIALTKGSSAEFYRFKGYAVQIYVTDSYHSHAVSRNGAVLAVFETDKDNIIHRVRVFDLFGVKEGKNYVSGGFTEIRESSKVTSIEAISASLIPYRAKDYTPLSVGYDLSEASPSMFTGSDRTDYFSSLASLSFRKDGAGLTIQKVTCSNGVDAEFGISPDPCFSSVIKVDDPDSVSTYDKLVARWDAGGVFRGVVRGDFSGVAPDVRFTGIGEGSSAWYGEITLSPTFSMVPTAEEDGFVYSGYSGDLIYGEGINQDGSLDYDSAGISCNPAALVFTASSSCGQTAEGHIVAPSFTVSGDDFCSVGDIYSVGGGVPPYSISISGVTTAQLSDTQVQVTAISECSSPGDPRWTTVFATDGCGQQAEKIVRLPGAVLNVVSDEQLAVIRGKPYFYPICCTKNGAITSPVYNPSSKTCNVTPGGYVWESRYGYCRDGHTNSCHGECSWSENSCVTRRIIYEYQCP